MASINIKDQCHYEKENNAYLPKYDNSDNEDQCHYEIKTDVSIDNNSDIEDRCDYDIKTDVSFSTDDNSDIWEMKHTCQLCGYQTSQKNNLKLHEQAVHEGKKYQCNQCEYRGRQSFIDFKYFPGRNFGA